MDWLEPWWHVAEENPELCTGYERELYSELASDHPLYGLHLAALAKNDGSDDVLFQAMDGSSRIVVVHLTWARHSETLPWPGFEWFANLAHWAEERMRPEHARGFLPPPK
jgi:hypothetical protein